MQYCGGYLLTHTRPQFNTIGDGAGTHALMNRTVHYESLAARTELHASLDSDIRQTFAFTKHDTFHSRNIDIPYDYIDNTVKARVYKWESMRAFMTAPARLAEDRTMFAHSLALFFYLGPSRRRVLEDDNWEYGDMG